MANAVIGALRVVLGMDSAAFEKGADAASRRLSALGKRFDKIGSGMQSFGQSLSLGVTLPLIGLGSASIKAAADAEKASAAVDQALKTMGNGAGFTADQFKTMAADIEKSTTFDGDDILSKVTANLLTFGKVQGDVFKRAQVLAVDLSARLGTDLQSATLQLGKALNDPVKGINALARAGVSFSAAQKQQIKDMVALNDVAGAQALILAEVEKQFGGQAAALAATNTGKLTQAYVQLGNASEEIGAVILPVLADLSVYVKDAAIWFASLSPEVKKFTVVAGGIAASLGPALIFFGSLVGSIGNVVKTLRLVGPAIGLLSGPVGIAALAVAGLVLAWQNWDTISREFPEIASLIEQSLGGLKIAFDGFVETSKLQLGVLNSLLKGDFAGAWRGAQETVFRAFLAMNQTVDSLFPGLTEGIITRVRAIPQAFLDMKNQVILYVQQMVDGVASYVTGKLNAVWDGVISKIETVKQAFRDMYISVVGNSDVPDMVTEVGQWMNRLDGGMVAPAVGATTATSSAFADMGQTISSSITGWVDQAIDGTLSFKTAITDLAKTLAQSGIQNLIAGIFGGGASGAFGGGAGSGIGGIFGKLFQGFFAKGGDFKANRAMMVGEKGPELMVPKRSGTVIPNSALRQSAPSSVTTYNIDATGADQAAIARLQLQLSDITRNMGKNAVSAVNRERNMNASFA